MLEIPYPQEELTQHVLKTVEKNGLKDAYIRLVVSRGAGDLGLDPNNCSNPSVIIIVEPLAIFPKHLYETGIDIVTVLDKKEQTRCAEP